MAKKGDGVKTTKLTVGGEQKGWDKANNRWETDDEYYTRMSRQDTNKAKSAEENLRNAVTSYKPEEFKYSTSNPYLASIQRQYGSGMEQTKEAITKNLASRGLTDSGLATRAYAKAQQAQTQDMANIAGQDYLRQYNQYIGEEQNRWNRLMGQYSVANQAYTQAKDDYFNQLAIQQQNAINEYQKQQANEINWGGVATTALGVGALTAGILTGGAAAPILAGPVSSALVSGGLTTAATGAMNWKKG